MSSLSSRLIMVCMCPCAQRRSSSNFRVRQCIKSIPIKALIVTTTATFWESCRAPTHTYNHLGGELLANTTAANAVLTRTVVQRGHRVCVPSQKCVN